MHLFGCWILPPATLLLTYLAWNTRHGGRHLSNPHSWIVQGALGGLIAAVAYDLYRLPFVLKGAPLFKVFPKFGQLLLGTDDLNWGVHLLGWLYHFSNGAALGIMFLALTRWRSRRMMFWGAVAWALFIEIMLLLTPYANFFGLAVNGRFLFLTVSAHLVFGIVLGLWCYFRFPSRQFQEATSA